MLIQMNYMSKYMLMPGSSGRNLTPRSYEKPIGNTVRLVLSANYGDVSGYVQQLYINLRS